MIEAPPRTQGIYLDVELHDAQMEVWNSDARFKVVACGRRFGKTFLGVNELIAAACSKPGAICWWVAPIYDQTDVAFRFFLEAIPPELVTVNRTKKSAVLWNGSIVAFRTSNDPDSLRAEGLDFVGVDEAAFQKVEVWHAVLRPALADKKGRALLIGTFDGENWFYDQYLRGQDPKYPEFESWRFPSSANPFLDPEEIAEAKRTTPHAEFEQEWMANPLVYVGAVFDGETIVGAVERGADVLMPYRKDLDTWAGLDWGYTNPTVFEINQEDAEGAITWFDERSWVATQLDTRIQHIVALCKMYGVIGIYADAAGADENAALAAALEDSGTPTNVVAVPFGKYKVSGIKARRWYLENGLERITPACEELIRTSKRYRYKENGEDVVKEDDHPVDAATAFYASRRGVPVGERG